MFVTSMILSSTVSLVEQISILRENGGLGLQFTPGPNRLIYSLVVLEYIEMCGLGLDATKRWFKCRYIQTEASRLHVNGML